MFKRYIYNTLGILSFITPLIISTIDWRTIAFMFFIYLIYLVISLIALVINGLVTSDFKDPDGLVPFMFFFFFIKDKRIYYSDLGYFYIRYTNKGLNKVYIYKQGYFFYKEIGSVYYNGNTESLSKEIKSEFKKFLKTKKDNSEGKINH